MLRVGSCDYESLEVVVDDEWVGLVGLVCLVGLGSRVGHVVLVGLGGRVGLGSRVGHVGRVGRVGLVGHGSLDGLDGLGSLVGLGCPVGLVVPVFVVLVVFVLAPGRTCGVWVLAGEAWALDEQAAVVGGELEQLVALYGESLEKEADSQAAVSRYGWWLRLVRSFWEGVCFLPKQS